MHVRGFDLELILGAKSAQLVLWQSNQCAALLTPVAGGLSGSEQFLEFVTLDGGVVEALRTITVSKVVGIDG